jgi:hypothetical protein
MRFLGGKREKINQAKTTAIKSYSSGCGPKLERNSVLLFGSALKRKFRQVELITCDGEA